MRTTKTATRWGATLLAALALIAVQAANVAADDDAKNKTGPTIADCQAAWERSPAYPDCGDRSDAPGATAETVEMAGTQCRITTGCAYKDGEAVRRGHSSWKGSPAQTERVEVCYRGKLDLYC